MKFNIILAFFIFSQLDVIAQGDELSVFTSAESSVEVCSNNAVRFNIEIRNLTNSNDFTDLRLFPNLPPGINYLSGSAVNMLAVNETASNLEFSIASIAATNTLNVSFEIISTCELKSYIEDNFDTSVPVFIKNQTELHYTSGSTPKIFFEPNGSESYQVKYPEIEVFVDEDNQDILAFQLDEPIERYVTIKNGGNGGTRQLNFSISYEENLIHNSLAIVDLNDDIIQLLAPVNSTQGIQEYSIAIFTSVGDGNDSFDRDEEIRLKEVVIPIGCNAAISSTYNARWGCETELCNEQDNEAKFDAYISAPGGSNEIQGRLYEVMQAQNICQNQTVKWRYEATNEGVGNTPTYFDGAYNVQLLITGLFDTNVVDILIGNGIDFSSVFDRVVNSGSNLSIDFEDIFTSDPDGAGIGLEDLDLDGYYDDLPVGHTFHLVLEFFYNLPNTAVCEEFEFNRSIAIVSLRSPSWCDKSGSGTNWSISRRSYQERSYDHTISGPNNLLSGEVGTYNLESNGNTTASYLFDCSNGQYISTVQVPSGYYYVNGSISDEFNSDLPISAFQSGNILTITQSISSSGVSFKHNYEFDLQVDCDFNPGDIDDFDWEFNYQCDQACPLDQRRIACGSKTVNNNCIECDNFATNSFDINRITLGWRKPTDWRNPYYSYDELFLSQTAEKVDPNVHDLRLDAGYPGDKVKVVIDGELTNLASTSFDNLHFEIVYDTQFDTRRQVLDFNEGEVYISDIRYYLPTDFVPTVSIVDNKFYIDFDIPMGSNGFPSTINPGQRVKLESTFTLFNEQYVSNNSKYELQGLTGSVFANDNSGDRQSCNTFPGEFTFLKPVTNVYTSSAASYRCDDLVYAITTSQPNVGQTDDFPNEFRPNANLKNFSATAPYGYKFNHQVAPNATSVSFGDITTYSSDHREIFIDFTNYGDMLLYDVGWSYGIFLAIVPDCNNPDNSFSYGRADGNFSLADQETSISNFGYYTRSYLPNNTDHVVENKSNQPFGFNNWKSIALSLEANSIQEGISRTVSWPVTLRNITDNFVNIPAENTWVAVELRPEDNSTILEGATDNDGNELDFIFYGPIDANRPLGRNLLVKLGQLVRNGFTELNINASYVNCEDDILQALDIYASWSCDGYPVVDSSVNTVVGLPDCEVPIWKDEMYIRYKTSNLQWTVERQGGDDPIDLCSPLPFEVTLLSSKYANINSIKVHMDLPEGVELNSSFNPQYQYPQGATYQDIPTEAIMPDGGWDITEILKNFQSDGELPGTRLPDQNELKLRFDLFGNCNFDPGQAIVFRGEAFTNCGESIQLNDQKKIRLLGFPIDEIDVSLSSSGFDDCSNIGTVDVSILNSGITATSQMQLQMLLPQGIIYEESVGEPSGSVNITLNPDGSTSLSWSYPSGFLQVNEQENFTINARVDPIFWGADFPFDARTIINGQAACVIDASTCDLVATTGETSISPIINRPILGVPIVINGDTEFCDGNTVRLEGPLGYSQYQWTLNGVVLPGAINRFLNVGESGSYSLVVDCYAPLSTVDVSVLPLPLIGIMSNVPTTCLGSEDGSLNFSISGDVGALYNYEILSSSLDLIQSGTIGDGGNVSILGLSAGTYQIIGENNVSLCSSSSSIIIHNGGPIASICATSVSCTAAPDGTVDSDVSITVNRLRNPPNAFFNDYDFEIRDHLNALILNGTGQFGEELSPKPQLPYIGENYTFHVLERGNRQPCEETSQPIVITPSIMTVALDNAEGIYKKCAQNETVNVQITPNLAATSCALVFDTFFTVDISKDGSPFSQITNQAAPINLALEESGNYEVTVTGNYGQQGNCSAMTAFTIEETFLNAELSVTNPTCNSPGDDGGAVVAVTGSSGPYSYNWYQGATLLSTLPTVSNLSAGTYRLELLGQFCTLPYIEEFDVVAPTPVGSSITINPPVSDCNMSAVLNNPGGTAPYTFEWITFEELEQTQSVFDPNTGNWVLSASVITVQNTAFTDENVIVSGGVATSFTSTQVVQAGDIKVIVTDSEGCEIESAVMNVVQSEFLREYALCFRWKTPARPEQTDIIQPVTVSTTSINSSSMVSLIQSEVEKCIENQEADFGAAYDQYCLSTYFLNDQVEVSYDVATYHHTLYYYDRAGNLTKTVPPKGVMPLPQGQLSRENTPSHTLVTGYDYNSLGQLVSQSSPDGGATEFIYNNIGQLRFSQNAHQAQPDKNTLSYTKYDALSRIVEVGEAELGNDYLAPDGTNYVINDFVDLESEDLLDLDKESYTTLSVDARYPTAAHNQAQQTLTTYTEPASVIYNGEGQTYLRNRVSYSTLINKQGETVTTYYSYDPHGNVKWLVQEIPGIGQNGIGYEYDLLSGNVLKVKYNEGAADQFFHRYEYDEDSRLKEVHTSKDNIIWENDASYEYYDHGPLKRAVIGDDEIQGIDYAYTLHGWIKAINNPIVGPDDTTAEDAFGMILGYYQGDFENESSMFNSASSNAENLSALENRNLYNGNISSWQIATRASDDTWMRTGFQYEYDLLNRIKTSNFSVKKDDGFKERGGFYADYSLDPNGNLLTLNRNDIDADHIDAFQYSLKPNTNQLTHVDDASIIAGDKHYNDLEDQEVDNYKYDAIGNLVRNEQDGSTIDWTVYGKVDAVQKDDNGSSTYFIYDAAGNRVAKKLTDPFGNVSTDYYVRDASGNVMAIYKEADKEGIQTVELQEVPLYGSDRIGLYKPSGSFSNGTTLNASLTADATIASYEGVSYDLDDEVEITLAPGFKFEAGLDADLFNIGSNRPAALNVLDEKPVRTLDEKLYELKDHLGNIRTTVTDRKLGDVSGGTPQNITPSIASAMAYYPYGMDMPTVKWGDESYKATYEGSEAVEEASEFLNYVEGQPFANIEMFNHTECTGCTRSQLLDGMPSGIIGLAKSLKVQNGDHVAMDVYGKYVEVETGSPLSDLVAGYGSALSTAFGLPTVGEGVLTSTNISDLIANGNIGATANGGSYEVRAYLNYMLFDEDFVFIDAGYTPLTDAAIQDPTSPVSNEHEQLHLDMPITQDGYIFMYLSNESDRVSMVYFDDFEITHTKLVPDLDHNPDLIAYRYGFNGKEKDQSGEWGDLREGASAVNSSDLLASYNFDGNAEDTSGNGFDGIPDDPALVADRDGEVNAAYSFDGTNDKITISHTPALNSTQELTVTAWIKASAPGSAGVIAAKHEGGNTNNQRGWMLSSGSVSGSSDDNKLQAVVSEFGANSSIKVYHSSLSVFDNTWHHVAMTFVNDELKIFIDGQEDTGVTKYRDDPVPSIYENSADVTLGYHLNNGVGDRYFNGSIDEVAIFNAALDAQSISAIANGEPIIGEPVANAGLAHYDYGFRIYNPAIGRFLSVDPLTSSYPMLTPYQFASNMPIWAVDLDGLEAVVTITQDLEDLGYQQTFRIFEDEDIYGFTRDQLRKDYPGLPTSGAVNIILDKDGNFMNFITTQEVIITPTGLQKATDNVRKYVEPIGEGFKEAYNIGVNFATGDDEGARISRGIVGGIIAVAVAIPTGGQSLGYLGTLEIGLATNDITSAVVDATDNEDIDRNLVRQALTDNFGEDVGLAFDAGELTLSTKGALNGVTKGINNILEFKDAKAAGNFFRAIEGAVKGGKELSDLKDKAEDRFDK